MSAGLSPCAGCGQVEPPCWVCEDQEGSQEATGADLTASGGREVPEVDWYCDRGPCAANRGHEGTCAEASGWADEDMTDSGAAQAAGEGN